MKRPARAHIFALIAAFVAIVAVSALWIVNLRSGPPFDGWTAGPMVIFVPFFLLIVTVIWLLIRGVLHGRVQWGAVGVVLAALALSAVMIVAYCGPVACFVPGNNRLLGWFIVGGAVLAAAVHHFVLNRFTPAAAHGR